MAYTITEKTTKILLVCLGGFVLLAFIFWGLVAAENNRKESQKNEKAMLVECSEKTDGAIGYCYDVIIAR